MGSCLNLAINKLDVDQRGYIYPSIEVGGNLAQADGGVATNWALVISGLQTGKLTHQFLVQVALIQLRSQKQHRLEREEKRVAAAGPVQHK